MDDLIELQYPVGRFDARADVEDDALHAAIQGIRELPERLERAVEGLAEARLDTPYRPGGWTVRQLVHHVADSHINAYCRCRLTVTEDFPTIRLYDQDRWAELPDGRSAPIGPSLALLRGLHARWVRFLEELTADDFSRRLRHPELGVMTMRQLVACYGWHSEHHVAHVTGLRERNGW